MTELVFHNNVCFTAHIVHHSAVYHCDKCSHVQILDLHFPEGSQSCGHHADVIVSRWDTSSWTDEFQHLNFMTVAKPPSCLKSLETEHRAGALSSWLSSGNSPLFFPLRLCLQLLTSASQNFKTTCTHMHHQHDGNQNHLCYYHWSVFSIWILWIKIVDTRISNHFDMDNIQ